MTSPEPFFEFPCSKRKKGPKRRESRYNILDKVKGEGGAVVLRVVGSGSNCFRRRGCSPKGLWGADPMVLE